LNRSWRELRRKPWKQRLTLTHLSQSLSLQCERHYTKVLTTSKKEWQQLEKLPEIQLPP
jgi:hypothetical protein